MIAHSDPLFVLETVASHGVPGPHGASLLDVGSKAYLSQFEKEVLGDLVSGGGATCRFFEGAYGSGKTHLLRLIAASALERGMAVAEAELAQGLKLEDWQGITKNLLERIRISAGDHEIHSLPRVLEHLGATNRDVHGAPMAQVSHPGFQQAMILALFPEKLSKQGAGLLRRYLLGERISTVALRKNGINGVKFPLSRRNAEHVLNTVVTTLHSLGVPGTILTFDENEKTFQTNRYSPPMRIRVAANLMRRLIDACPTGRVRGLVAVFAVLPGFLRDCSRFYEALGQRLQIPQDGGGTAWRWAVLPIDGVNEVLSPEEFLKRVSQRFEGLAKDCGRKKGTGLRKRLITSGQEILEEHAGSGYRRPLMKRLASLTLEHMEN